MYTIYILKIKNRFIYSNYFTRFTFIDIVMLGGNKARNVPNPSICRCG